MTDLKLPSRVVCSQMPAAAVVPSSVSRLSDGPSGHDPDCLMAPLDMTLMEFGWVHTVWQSRRWDLTQQR